MRPSTIREILKVTAQPEVISFAGGLPAPELFPVAEIKAAADFVLSNNGSEALQYSESEGFRPLRDWIAAEMGQRGIKAAADDVLITNGSQQGLDLVGKLFLNPGDVVLTENPTYLAAIQAFQTFEAEFVPVPTDADGLIPEALPDLIKKHRPKFLYSIPNFQNPTGITMSAPRRQTLAKIAAEYALTVVEDDPYGKLRYRGAEIPPVKHWDTAGRIIYASTFSKTIAPGLRIGWLALPSALFNRTLILKQASDLHTSSFDQRVAHTFLTQNDQKIHLEKSAAPTASATASSTMRCVPPCRAASRGPSPRAACLCGSPARRTSTPWSCWSAQSSRKSRSSPAVISSPPTAGKTASA